MKQKAQNRFDEMKHAMEHGRDEFVSESPTTMEQTLAETGLGGMKIAVIVADGFDQREFDGPVQALRKAGATVQVLAEDEKHLTHIEGVRHFEVCAGTRGDQLLEAVTVEEYDGLLIPGGLVSPDTMRQSRGHLDFVRAFVTSGKPVASICHGPWVLADADVLKGRKTTSWPGIRRDLERAGAHWSDQPVVIDGNLITSRDPKDVPVFSEAFIGLLATSRKV